MTLAYYNEIDPYAAAWLRNLIDAGHIAYGDVDERDIRDVRPSELSGYTQCHFFAGIGAWSHALRLAGWPDERPVWTGSCPCQPFSAAGKGGGFDDERHLWPAWFHLINSVRPVKIFGEQVASPDGLSWLDLIQADLEGADYASGAVDVCAASVGAPHIRQRLWFVADALQSGRPERGPIAGHGQIARSGIAGELGHTRSERQPQRGIQLWEPQHKGEALFNMLASAGYGEACELGDADDTRLQGQRGEYGLWARPNDQEISWAGPFWHNAKWLPCTDGKARPIEPGSFPLAHGATARVGRLRAYGNAIVARCAAEFVVAAS